MFEVQFEMKYVEFSHVWVHVTCMDWFFMDTLYEEMNMHSYHACACSKDMTLDHAMACPTGGYPLQRNDDLRDVIAGAMSEICPDVQTEPVLHSLTGEVLDGRTAIREDDARLDIKARGFWTRQ